MGRFSAAIRSKPECRRKRRNADITSKWRTEAAAIDPLLTPPATQYVLDELDYYDQLLDSETGIEMAVVDGVWQSDTLLPTELVAELKAAVQQCWGHLTTEQRDWHPGSNGQVWDILHPSLYCLVAGRTHMLADDADDITLERSMAVMGSGRVLSVAEYGRQLQERMAAMNVNGDRWQLSAQVADSDDEITAARQQAAAELAKQAQRSPEALAAEAEAAWKQGKIALRVWPLRSQPISSGQPFTIYVPPDARLTDVRAAMAEQWPTSWRSWTLNWSVRGTTSLRGRSVPSQQLPLQMDDPRPLHALGIRSTTTSLLAVEDKLPADVEAQTKRERRAKAAIKPVRITVSTEQGAPISVHRLDQSATIATLLQQLCDGTGETSTGCYPVVCTRCSALRAATVRRQRVGKVSQAALARQYVGALPAAQRQQGDAQVASRHTGG